MEIIPAGVQIEQGTLYLAGTGEFTATITFSEGYHVKQTDISAVVCEGAPAVYGRLKGTLSRKGSTYTAKFKPQDMINITAGETATFTVSVIAEQDGKQVAFEGSDTVMVVSEPTRVPNVPRSILMER